MGRIFPMSRVQGLVLSVRVLSDAVDELTARIAKLEAGKLELKPSRKPKEWTTPRCANVPCGHHTAHASGYCKTHRDAVVKVNGLVQSTQDGRE